MFKLKSRLKYLSFLIVSLCFTIRLSKAEEQPLFKLFDLRSENTRPKILKLLLDHNGLIWTGTDKGIFTFDGINFIKIPNSDSVSSPVSALFEDSNFHIWAGYENGNVFQVKNQMLEKKDLKNKISRVPISAFAEDDAGRIFFSTKGEGIFCLDSNKIYSINNNDGLSDNYCYSMVKLPDQRICVGTDAGLNFVSFKDGIKKISVFGSSEGLPDDIARTLIVDKDKQLWIGLQEHGVARYDCKSNKLGNVKIKNRWSYGQINNLLIQNNQIWAATEENGIIIIDKNGITNRFNLNENENLKPSDFIIDFENNIWLAESIHLIRTSGNKIRLLNKIGSKELRNIHCIKCDRYGNLWFSPDQQIGTIFRDHNGELNYKEFKVTEKFTDIVTLYFDQYGYLWIGTLGEGVYRLNPHSGNVRKITDRRDPEISSILSINGKGNTIWVGGFNSVIKYNIESKGYSEDAVIRKENVFKESELINDYVYAVYIDSKERIWFGTDGSGIYYYDREKLRNIPVKGNMARGFTEDKKGRIWYLTAEAGLESIDTNQIISYFQVKDGLSDPSPSSIICDKSGKIIVVHSNGFDVINPETNYIIYHSSEENLDGINSDPNSIAISNDSDVWIGTEKGILHYQPSNEFVINQPKVILQSVSVFLNAIDFRTKNEFSYDENNFRFDYTGLWYSDPQRINYFFMLVGYSTKWESTKDHSVTFPKLPPGKYVFRIKASLNSANNPAEEVVYTFWIKPPIWQRWWFRLILAATISILFYQLIKKRDERLRKFERLQKEKIEFQFETLKSQVNPHFLFNSFNTLISVIENTPKLAVEYVERLSDFFRSIVNYRDKNLITLKEELEILNNYLFIQQKRYGNNLRLKIIIDEITLKEKCIAPLTLQLLAENAIKHNAVSIESPLTISIIVNNENLIISNNINPKFTKETSAGFGLQNIKSRYQLLSDRPVEIQKDNDRFVVKIPLINYKDEYSHS